MQYWRYIVLLAHRLHVTVVHCLHLKYPSYLSIAPVLPSFSYTFPFSYTTNNNTTMSTTKPAWVDGPYPLIVSPSRRAGATTVRDDTFKGADIMCNAHNVFIRGFNALVLQARGISLPRDVSDFCQFYLCMSETLHHHHTNEEEIFFKSLENALGRPGAMSINVQQHAAFEAAQEELDKYCSNTKLHPDEYSADKFLALTESLADPLIHHLHAEIDMLVDLKNQGDPTGSITKKCMDDWELHQMKVASKVVDYPYALYTHDSTYENGIHAWWPPAPWLVLCLVHYGFARWYQGAWRFAPCERGRPRELGFLPK